MRRLEDRVVIVTGGTSGIGRAIAEQALREGAWVLNGSLDGNGGGGDFAASSDRAAFIQTDVTREDDVEALIGEALRRHGRVDAMINNAGSSGVAGGIADIGLEGYQFTVDTLLRSVFLGTKHAARVMTERGSGVIINMASIAGISTYINASHIYSATKAAVVQLTRTSALELGPSGVRVNCICPGYIATPIFGRALGLPEEELPGSVEVARDIFRDMQPLRRSGEAQDIAEAAIWLASDGASFVTGHALVVDGGASCGTGWDPAQNRFGRLAAAIRRTGQTGTRPE